METIPEVFFHTPLCMEINAWKKSTSNRMASKLFWMLNSFCFVFFFCFVFSFYSILANSELFGIGSLKNYSNHKKIFLSQIKMAADQNTTFLNGFFTVWDFQKKIFVHFGGVHSETVMIIWNRMCDPSWNPEVVCILIVLENGINPSVILLGMSKWLDILGPLPSAR